MNSRTILGAVALATVGLSIAIGDDKSDAKTGYKAGESMPFQVVDFVVRGKGPRGGCPSVMISNSRSRGMIACSRSADEAAFELAGALEGPFAKHSTSRAFLIFYDNTAKDSLLANAEKHGLKALHVGVPRSSTKSRYQRIDGESGSSLIVFFMDRKTIKEVRRFKPGELTEGAIDDTARAADRFLAGNE